MQKITASALMFVVLVIFASATLVFAQEADISTILKKVVTDNFEAYQVEDLDAVLLTVHSQAPGYEPTKQVSQQLFPQYDLKYELLNFKYLTIDGAYAFARARQKTEKISGPAFRDNIIDIVFAFKKENNAWKFWSQVVLDVDFLN